MAIPKVRAAITVFVFVCAGSASAQQRTIPEVLAAAGQDQTRSHGAGSGTVGDPRSDEYERRFTDLLLANTDLIVRGVVGQPERAYLSDDHIEVYTDYAIQNPMFLYDSSLQRDATPGAMPSARVTVFGGTVTIDGLSYTSVHESLRVLESGSECVFLLKRVGTRYLIALDYVGAFRISGDYLSPLSAEAGLPTRYREARSGELMAEWVAQLSATRHLK